MDSKPTFGVLKVPTPQAGDYLETLHQWGELPEVVTVPDAAQLLATLCKQNKAALMKIIERAIWEKEINFWGLSHHGGWRESMMRVLHKVKGKPRVKPQTPLKDAEFTFGFDATSRLHLEAMGVNPAELVMLLHKRGRKVPDALMGFTTGPQQSDAAARHAETPAMRQAKRYQACIDAGLVFSSNPLHGLPRGIGAVAKSLCITRQSLTTDLGKHIERLHTKSS